MFTLVVAMTALVDSHAHELQDETSQLARAPDLPLWLVGCWQGEALGGVVTECWLPPAGGQMTGVFQLEQEGALAFTEHLTIGQVGDVHGYFVKHFNPDLSGWEESDGYVAFAHSVPGEREWRWDGLVYRLTGDGHLHIELDMHRADGSVMTLPFQLDRLEP